MLMEVTRTMDEEEPMARCEAREVREPVMRVAVERVASSGAFSAVAIGVVAHLEVLVGAVVQKEAMVEEGHDRSSLCSRSRTRATRRSSECCA